MSFHTVSLPEDRCARLHIKNLGRRMPEDVVREELRAPGICVQGVMQLRSGHRDRDPEKDHPVTPHFIVTVARGPEASKVRSITQLCGLRVTVETYTAPKGPLQYKRLGHAQRNCLGVWRVGRLTFQASAQPPESSLNAAAAEVTTPPTTGAAGIGKMLRLPLQGGNLRGL